MDLNHIFLFIAVISPLLVLAKSWRPGAVYRAWRVASVIVLVVTGLAWVFFRELAGFIGGAVWLVLLFIPAIGLRKVTELAARHQYRSARKLATILLFFHPSAELRQQIQFFRTLESDDNAGSVRSFSPRPNFPQPNRPWRLQDSPTVGVLIFLNVVVFLVELYFGIDGLDLHRMGALEPFSVVVLGQYWRLVTALFLHASFTHLVFNLFALYVLGPALERTIGSVRFAAAYLIAGIGSSLGVVGLTMLAVIRAAQVVGASGCVLGIVGVWAGILLRQRHAPRASERLMNIALIVGIQMVFDLTTPQVSSAAHICGIVTGFAVGLLMGPRAERS